MWAYRLTTSLRSVALSYIIAINYKSGSERFSIFLEGRWRSILSLFEDRCIDKWQMCLCWLFFDASVVAEYFFDVIWFIEKSLLFPSAPIWNELMNWVIRGNLSVNFSPFSHRCTFIFAVKYQKNSWKLKKHRHWPWQKKLPSGRKLEQTPWRLNQVL